MEPDPPEPNSLMKALVQISLYSLPLKNTVAQRPQAWQKCPQSSAMSVLLPTQWSIVRSWQLNRKYSLIEKHMQPASWTRRSAQYALPQATAFPSYFGWWLKDKCTTYILPTDIAREHQHRDETVKLGIAICKYELRSNSFRGIFYFRKHLGK